MIKKALGLAFFMLVTACGSPGEDPTSDALTKSAEPAASSAEALTAPARAQCNSRAAPNTFVVAMPLAGEGPNATYRGVVSDLVEALTACGTSDCKQQRDYTSAIYAQIPGAAAYYYKVRDRITFYDANQNPYYETANWIAIPIVDSTTTYPSYYSSYPGPSVIHTPAYGLHIYRGNPQTTVPFWLCDGEPGCYRMDHTSLWTVVWGALNTPAVDGRVKPEPCVAIVDPQGNFLDFSAELEEHDPNGCSSCKK